MNALHERVEAERLALGWHWLATFISFLLLTSAIAGFVVIEPLAHAGGLLGGIFFFVALSCMSVAVVEVFAVIWHIFSIREHMKRVAELK